MLVPGLEFPHLCVQCQDYPCVKTCPVRALSVSKKTGAVIVKTQKCTACGKCINACPGRIPHMHPTGLLGGPDFKWSPKIHDENPQRFYEPLPSGPYMGKTVDRAKVKEDRSRYYREAGWDENGVPKTETLRELELENIDESLKKLRR